MHRKRRYDSRLRKDQAEQTRERIFEALVEQVADAGLTDFSIEQLAHKAGVSTRTVYHHFPKRDVLLDGFSGWMDAKATGSTIADTATVEELLAHIGAVFEVFDQQESLIRAHLATELGRQVRARGRSRRRPAIEAIVRREAPSLPDKELQRATALIHYMTSSEAWRSMKDESGLSGKDAGQTVQWAIQALLVDLKRKALETAVDEGDRK